MDINWDDFIAGPDEGGGSEYQDKPITRGGKRTLRIVWAGGGHESSTGKHGISFKGVVAAGEPGAGESAWGSLWFDLTDPSQTATTMRQVVAAGVPKTEVVRVLTEAAGDPQQVGEAISALLVEQHVTANVKLETYNSETRPKIGFLNPAPTGFAPTANVAPSAQGPAPRPPAAPAAPSTQGPAPRPPAAPAAPDDLPF